MNACDVAAVLKGAHGDNDRVDALLGGPCPQEPGADLAASYRERAEPYKVTGLALLPDGAARKPPEAPEPGESLIVDGASKSAMRKRYQSQYKAWMAEASKNVRGRKAKKEAAKRAFLKKIFKRKWTEYHGLDGDADTTHKDDGFFQTTTLTVLVDYILWVDWETARCRASLPGPSTPRGASPSASTTPVRNRAGTP